MAFTLLLANKDSTIERTISRFLSTCEHHEIERGNLNDCMKSLMKVRETLGPYMLTNMNRIRIPGFSVAISRIQKLLNVNIIALQEDGAKISKRKGIYVSAYILNISSIKMMNRLWEEAMAAAPPIDRKKHLSDGKKKKKKIIVTSSSSSSSNEEESLPLPLPPPPPPPPPPSSVDLFHQGGVVSMDTDEIFKEIEDGNCFDNQDSGSTNYRYTFFDELENLDPEEFSGGADDN